MKFTVRYGKGNAAFETNVPCLVADMACPECPDPDLTIERAIGQNLDGALGFLNFAKNCKKLLFILCDGTRPTPTALVLKHLNPHFMNLPDFRFIIATGSHRVPTDVEFHRIFGQFHDEFRPRTSVHDAKDAGALKYVGTTSRGTPVFFNRAVLDADGIVTINSVEPHYFAGYTGGRKSFLPGVSGYDSIERNHSHACEPGALPMNLRGNPVSEDMQEAADFLSGKRIFSVQTVMMHDGHLHSAFAGEPDKTFRDAVDTAQRLFSVEIPRRADIVITVAQPPMDCNLYQSQKALEHGRAALAEGGIMILVASCWDGIGDRGFYDMLSCFKEGETVSDYMGKNYKLGNHKGARMLSLAEHASIWAVTELDDETLKQARIRGFVSLQEAVDRAVGDVRARGIEPSIIVLPGGSLTVPRVGR